MAEKWVLNEDEAMELLTLLIVSARIQLDEPAQYGPLRLLTAADRLSGFIKARASKETRPLLTQMTEEIPQLHMQMSDVEGYTAALDNLCKAVAGQLVERYGLAEAQS